ncbi:hypothetical protein ACFLR1_04850 [Bacteroidota bacterium]
MDYIEKIIFTSDDHLWSAIEIKKQNLTDNLDMFEPHSGEAKYVFRLTVPAVMRLFQLSKLQMYCVQFFLGFGVFILWASLSFSIFTNYKDTLISTLALACVYYGKSFLINPDSPVETVSYFLILWCIFFRDKSWLLAIGLIALFFNDERGILAYPIIGLTIMFWHDNQKHNSLRQWIRTPALWTLVLMFSLGCLIRLFLQETFEMATPINEGGVNLNLFRGQWKFYHLGVFSGLVGFVIIYFQGFVKLIRKKENYVFLIFCSLILLSYLIGTALVSDMTKTISYAVPLSLPILYKLIQTEYAQKTIMRYVLVVNVAFPSLVIIGSTQLNFYNTGFDLIFFVINLLT